MRSRHIGHPLRSMDARNRWGQQRMVSKGSPAGATGDAIGEKHKTDLGAPWTDSTRASMTFDRFLLQLQMGWLSMDEWIMPQDLVTPSSHDVSSLGTMFLAENDVNPIMVHHVSPWSSELKALRRPLHTCLRVKTETRPGRFYMSCMLQQPCGIQHGSSSRDTVEVP